MTDDYLSDRWVIYGGDKWSLKEEMTCGAPQGSRVGPLVWNVMNDNFLHMDLPAETSIIGLMNDALVVYAADDIRIPELRVNDSLWREKRWLDSRCLKMAPEKSEALLVTSRRSFQCPKIVQAEHEIEWKWQKRWHGDQCRRWTHRPIPELATWLCRKHGQAGFYPAQALSGLDCFNPYLKRFRKRDDESCRYCRFLAENTEYTLFFYVYRVIRHPGDEYEGGRWMYGARQQQGPVEIASLPVPAVLGPGWTWLSASFGGGIFSFLPWLARLVGSPNRRVATDGSPGRSDDGRIVRDFKLEPTAATFKAERRFRGRSIGTREGFFGFNRYYYTF